jgi:hypothetical protein
VIQFLSHDSQLIDSDTKATPNHTSPKGLIHRNPKRKTIKNKDNMPPTQYQCSICTGGVCTSATLPTCSRCNSAPVLTCARCLGGPQLPASTCVECTPRPHICLSKCLRRCVRATGRVPCCRCGADSRRFQVRKAGRNKDRWFWTCAQSKCKTFEWERV